MKVKAKVWLDLNLKAKMILLRYEAAKTAEKWKKPSAANR